MAVRQYELKIKTKNDIVYSFIVKLRDIGDGEQKSITIGSTRKQHRCVEILVGEDEEGAPFNDSGLEDFIYDSLCADSNNLRRGADGSAIMLLASFHMLYELFPAIKKTTIADNSMIENTSLVNYYILKTGTSWYGNWLRALPQSSRIRRNLAQIREKLNKIVNITYESFISESHMRNVPELKTIYNAAVNNQRWRALFIAISNHPSLKQDLMAHVTDIYDMLDLPNMHLTNWTANKADVHRLIANSMTIISLKATTKNIGMSAIGGGLRYDKRELVYMYGGRVNKSERGQ